MKGSLRNWIERRARWALPAAVLLGMLAVGVADPTWVQGLRFRAFDAFLSQAPRAYKDLGVRVIDIDEETLAKVGQWPWPRPRLEELIGRLRDLGASAIVFDAVFPEPDRTSPAAAAALWPDDPGLREIKARVSRLPDHDERMAKAMRRSRVVLGFAPLNQASPRMPTEKGRFSYPDGDLLAFLPSYEGGVVSLPVLEAAAAGVGSIGYAGEYDGVIRRAPLVSRLGGKLYPSLALEAVRVAAGADRIVLSGTKNGLTGVRIGPRFTPTDSEGRIWINYPAETPGRTIPAWKIFDRKSPPPGLKGVIAFIGPSAEGLKDLRATPLTPIIPGVQIHADIAEQLLGGGSLSRPDWAIGAETFFTAVTGLLLLILLSRLGAAWSAPIGVGAILATVGLSWAAFTSEGLLLDPVLPGLTLAATYASFSAAAYVLSERDRRRITGTFGRYLSPKVVDALARSGGKVELGGETREMTFHFCDIRGFTTISEKFDPHGLTEFINRFLTPMTQLILDHDGTIDKYMGDCIMAFWNAPHAVPDHAAKACAASLAMHAELKRLNAAWKAENPDLPEIHIGTGLNTGPCVVGNMGSALRVDYTVLGDDVNLASRLEGQSKTYGVNIVIGPHTREAAPQFAALELDLIKVKGKTKPVRIFALLGSPETAKSEEFTRLEKAHATLLARYRAREWAKAEEALFDVKLLGQPWSLDVLCGLYRGRIRAFLAEPPPKDWDGVFTATSK